jgi:hypothetical protein
MARSLRMTLERRKTDDLDGKLTISELEKLMYEVILLREKVARAELERAPPDATTHGRQSFPSPKP